MFSIFKEYVNKGRQVRSEGETGSVYWVPPRQKWYQIYDIKDGKFVVSRDVRFVENEFPFKTPNSQQEAIRNVESDLLNGTTHEDENLATLEGVGKHNKNPKHVQS